jgi:hypothetical protein
LEVLLWCDITKIAGKIVTKIAGKILHWHFLMNVVYICI